MILTLQIVIAFIADLLVGDPKGYPHPVKIIARLALWLESITRKSFSNPRLAGIVTTLSIVSISFLIVWLVVWSLTFIHPWLGCGASVFFIYTSLSIRSLYDESLPVLRYLQENKLVEARKSLSMIVGRDTENLDNKNIVRATVETVAESTVDGIIAPLFFAVLGGAPGVIAYKAVNTMDSLFGYKNDKYFYFGWASARLDDLANWVPARISIPIIATGAMITGLNGKNAMAVGLRDGSNHPSPNSGYSEATMAGALEVRLGGNNYYSGKLNIKPYIGDDLRKLEFSDIEKSHKLMFSSASIAIGLIIVIKLIQNTF
ncbi:MAG: cobalamin biosynthesis protein CobD [Nitrospinaceae bacterium]|jgi:adenosylcobinamide-phosphate synthase|nr:cobalamin biosynthesis protein CobD [Nitrospina sp.]MBT5867587.1 cobalamin biosynthesis protein CobD [Nitrospinaceae bacterium]